MDRPVGVNEVEAPRILRQSAHECARAVSPTQRPPLLPREDPCFSFLLEAKSTPGPQYESSADVRLLLSEGSYFVEVAVIVQSAFLYTCVFVLSVSYARTNTGVKHDIKTNVDTKAHSATYL